MDYLLWCGHYQSEIILYWFHNFSKLKIKKYHLDLLKIMIAIIIIIS